MAEQVTEKVNLNEVTHSVRASQAVLQYGVGAMVDFPDQTLMTTAPEYWSGKAKIDDERFAKALGVDFFAVPTDISYARFPEWYFCPRCRKFQPISKWQSEYKRKANQRSLQNDAYMVKHMNCPNCYQDLVVARIVTVCEHGHINDFPWVEWVHKIAKKPICSNPRLSFKTGASGTEGLEGLSVSCEECHAFATLKGAFDSGKFEDLDRDAEVSQFRCQGGHPHKHEREKCILYPKTVQRGSSSVYFPVVYSSLVIPPYADRINIKIVNSQAFERAETTLSQLPDMKDVIMQSKFPDWIKEIAIEIGANEADVEVILRRKWLEQGSNEIDAMSIQYRAEEYAALSGEMGAKSSLGEFSREAMPISDYNLPYIKSISLIDKVRVVNALIGFSRLNPVIRKDDPGFIHVKEPETRWYPAYEVRGEGIFIEFEQSEIDRWVERNPNITNRVDRINTNYAQSFIGQSYPRKITPKFVMLHTLSHLLIRQLSFECGYSVASLCERIYCAETNEGKQMAGIFIYTASGDSEGTLGGLVRQGLPDAFPRVFKKAIASAKTCSNDPVCILSHGQGLESLNLAACHACVLLPETCCEERNIFLDRGLILGTLNECDLGFYKDFI
ncbi:DUF1998 domain-containing protein [uncultured Paenibacillus sp.]|uniref:DUF1998 domain-containing protein n=1 Tax=uncultured Paenibacillus sp. TaxID=227322 RepID=UPI0015B2045C|nr:DUF1998 domain-containing protein [uncultured Paenibacillus sp.]